MWILRRNRYDKYCPSALSYDIGADFFLSFRTMMLIVASGVITFICPFRSLLLRAGIGL